MKLIRSGKEATTSLVEPQAIDWDLVLSLQVWSVKQVRAKRLDAPASLDIAWIEKAGVRCAVTVIFENKTWAWKAEWDPVRRPHQGQQSHVDCINRPNRRLHPTSAKPSDRACNAGAIHRGQSALEPVAFVMLPFIGDGGASVRGVTGFTVQPNEPHAS